MEDILWDGGKAAGIPAELHTVVGKKHGMVSSEPEMRALMTFWAKTLQSGTPRASEGQEYLEVSPSSSASVLKARGAKQGQKQYLCLSGKS